MRSSKRLNSECLLALGLSVTVPLDLNRFETLTYDLRASSKVILPAIVGWE
jgi:hypothetical protein